MKKTRFNYLIPSLFLLISCGLCSQQFQNEYTVKFTSEEIMIDGNDYEKAWSSADSTYTQWRNFPSVTNDFESPTLVRMLYDDSFIYVLCKAFTKNDNFVIQSLRWDFSGRAADKINLAFDTFSDGNNAYHFGSNPLGVRADALISNGGVTGTGSREEVYNRSWDGKWDVDGKVYPGYYLTEFKIPFSTLHYPKDSDTWRFNFTRMDTQTKQRTTWSKIPQQFNSINLSFMGKIKFEKGVSKLKSKISLIPYINAISSTDKITDKSTNNISFGGDVKIPISSGLNLDLTVNPDFSQVEVDNEIINLTMFEIKMEEKRQFFLQNRDIFSNFGAVRTTSPFFTRRIGLSRNTDGDVIQNKIIGGLRLSGKINNNLKIGVLSMLTEEDILNEIPSNLNTVVSLHQKVFNSSAIKFLFINREITKDYDFVDKNDTFNRLVGLEYDLISKGNLWNGRFFAYNSFSPLKKEDGFSGGVRLTRETRKHKINFEYSYLGDDYRTDLGILRRIGASKLAPYYEYTIFPKKSKLNNISFGFYYWLWFKLNTSSENILENNFNIPVTFTFNNQSEIQLLYRQAHQFFKRDFDPTGINNDNPLAGGKIYKSNYIQLAYESNPTEKFYFTLSQNYGMFYDGNKYSFENSFNLRVQPRLSASMIINYDIIKLRHLKDYSKLWLVGPKIDYTFNKKLFWSNLIQFSSQSENFGINSRLQWRFSGLSNLFLVFNDNYLVKDELIPRMRSFNLKLLHWF